MQPKEGESPGSLYKYTEAKRREIQEAERLTKEAERRQAELDAEQRRTTYEKLPERFRSLFSRFSAIELLEEVRNRFWKVSYKDDSDSMSVVSIMGNPGIKLESHSQYTAATKVYSTYSYEANTGSINSRTASSGRWEPAGYTTIDQLYSMYVIAEEPKPPRNYYRVGGEKELLFVIDKGTEPTGSESDYDLRFLFFRDPHYHYNDPSVPNGSAPPTIDRRIKATEPPDTLKRVIGDYLLS